VVTALPEYGAERSAMLREGADAIWTWSAGAEELALCAGLRWISTPAAGADYLDVETLLRSGWIVTTSHGHHGPAIAEHAWAMALMLARGFHHGASDRAAASERPEFLERVLDVAGSHCLLLGIGGVGSAIATRALAFGCSCSALGREARIREDGVRVVELTDLDAELHRSRFVFNSLPGGEGTHQLLAERRLSLLPSPAVLVNVGRGSTVDEEALLRRVRAGQLRAGLDVVGVEPVAADSPLRCEADVVLTPHVAAVTPDYLLRAAEQQAAQMQRFSAGEPLHWQEAGGGCSTVLSL